MSFLIPTAFGLDISDESVKAIGFRKNHKGFEPLFWGSMEIPEGIIQQGDILQEEKVVTAIREALGGAKGEKIQSPYVAFSLPEEKSFVKVIEMPAMKEKELEGALLLEAENHIPLAVEEAAIGFQVIPKNGDDKGHLDILLSAVPRAVVERYISVVKKTGLVPVLAEPESLSIARCLVKREAHAEPTLIIDFGASRTTFIVVSGNSVRFTTSIAISSEMLTEAIAASLGLSEAEAEKLKVTHGLNKRAHGGKLYGAMEPLLSDLTTQIERQLRFYQSHATHEHTAGERIVNKVILSGGGSLLSGLEEYLQKGLNRAVVLGDPLINVFERDGKKGIAVPKLLSYTTAIGLALEGQNFLDLH